MTWDVKKGVSFGDYHSFEDWGLYLRSMPEISPPEPKTNYIDIPGMNGSLDLTESLTGGVVYNLRDLSFEFSTFDDRQKWLTTYSDVQNKIHGRQFKIVLDENPDYYYTGRVQVKSLKQGKNRGYLSVSAKVDPYKYEIVSSIEDWLWDPFNFEIGIIRNYKNIAISGTKTVLVDGRGKPTIPTITISCSGNMTVKITYDGASKTKTYSSGTYNDSDMRIREGSNTFKFTGTGTVSIDYRGSSL